MYSHVFECLSQLALAISTENKKALLLLFISYIDREQEGFATPVYYLQSSPAAKWEQAALFLLLVCEIDSCKNITKNNSNKNIINYKSK